MEKDGSEMSERGLGFILPTPPVLAGGIALLVWLFRVRAKAATPVTQDVFNPAAVAAAIDVAVRPDVKELEKKKKTARRKVSKSLDKAEKRTKAPAKKKDIKEAKDSVDTGKPSRKKIERAKKDDKEVKKDYDAAVDPVRRQRRRVEKKAKKIKDDAEREAKRQVDKFTGSFPKGVRGHAEAAFRSIKTGKLDTSELKKLGKREGKKFVEKYAKEFGATELTKSIPALPKDIPVRQIFEFLSDPSAENLAKAGVSAASDYASAAVSSYAGFPVDFPNELSAKAFIDSALGVIPTNLNDVIGIGLAVGGQVAATAITSALAGTAIGSVIPGLGTIVGLGVGIMVGLLKDELKEEPPPFQRKCPTKFKCPKVPAKSPIELIPWAVKVHADASRVVAADQKKKFCGTGSSVSCASGMHFLIQRCYFIVLPLPKNVIQGQRAAISTSQPLTTIDVIGLPEVKRLLPKYKSAPSEFDFFDDKKKKVVKEQNTKMLEILSKLRARRRQLDEMISRLERLETSANLSKDRFDLSREIEYASQQVFLSPSKESKDWLRTLGSYYKRLERREKHIFDEMVTRHKADEETRKKNIARGTHVTYQID